MNDVSLAHNSGTATLDFRQMARGIGTVVTYGAGDVIFREGDGPTYAYIVLSGRIEVSAHGKIIEQVDEGRAFGIISVVDKKSRSATATAVENSEIALLDSRQFRYMVETVPNFVWYVLGEVVDRLRATNSAL